jgi:glycosyltransferase involved in cell wall biosynthesis
LFAVILIPVYNDYAALALLFTALQPLIVEDRRVMILIVDDGSTVTGDERWHSPADTRLPVQMLRLRRNVGHQRAIAIGLTYIYRHLPCDAVVVMDGDGEDRPEDVPRLMNAFEQMGRSRIVFAERTRRSEGVWFRFFYLVYRLFHRSLTGIPVRFGNFSIVPFEALSSLVVASELWNHYAAAIVKLRLCYTSIPTTRGRRASGRSSLDFVALVVHGLSAASVFGDVIGVRLAIATGLVTAALGSFLAMTAADAWFSGGVSLPWLAVAGVVFALLLGQLFVTSWLVLMLVLGSRASTAFIPLRDHEWFIRDCVDISPVERATEPVFYAGMELEVFSGADNWKAYWKTFLDPYVVGDVLEIGAGIGSNTLRLRESRQRRWVCVEPDPVLAARLRAAVDHRGQDLHCEIVEGTIARIERRPQFEAILYLDVLEHIADERTELAEAAARLRPGGHLIVLAPAHERLYSEFDRAIGHHRRYTKDTLSLVIPDDLELVRLLYLDAIGLALSASNRWFLKQAQPTAAQVRFWDRLVVPCSRVVDRVCNYRLGKSVLGVWRRTASTATTDTVPTAASTSQLTATSHGNPNAWN